MIRIGLIEDNIEYRDNLASFWAERALTSPLRVMVMRSTTCSHCTLAMSFCSISDCQTKMAWPSRGACAHSNLR